MRELKFRAWYNREKKYLYPWPDGFAIFGETTCFDLIGQQLGKDTLEKLNDVVIEQYTNFKDSDGKEIYEGDIVAFYIEISDMETGEEKIEEYFRSTVEWKEELGRIGITKDYDDYMEWTIQNIVEWLENDDCLKLESYKIIGNIYVHNEEKK